MGTVPKVTASHSHMFIRFVYNKIDCIKIEMQNNMSICMIEQTMKEYNNEDKEELSGCLKDTWINQHNIFTS